MSKKKFSQSPVNHSQLVTSNAHKILGSQDKRKETSCRAGTLQMPCRGASYQPSQQLLNRCTEKHQDWGQKQKCWPVLFTSVVATLGLLLKLESKCLEGSRECTQFIPKWNAPHREEKMTLRQTLQCWHHLFFPETTPEVFLQWAGKTWNKKSNLINQNHKWQKKRSDTVFCLLSHGYILIHRVEVYP